MQVTINEVLNEWFKQQKNWQTRADFARAIEINESTLGDYFKGRRKPSHENKQKLFKATGLEFFKPIDVEVSKAELTTPEPEKWEVPWNEVGQQLIVIGEAFTQLGKLLTRSTTSDVTTRIQAVEDTLYTLNDNLEFFKKGPPHSRKILRQRLSGADVGYITTFLKALFDEERFQNWLAMTTHEVRR